MDTGPLVAEQIEAGAKFLDAFEKYLPAQAAFWLKDGEDGMWYLYVASDQITDENFDVAYGEVHRITQRNQDPWFDPFKVKVVGADEPLAKAVTDLRRRYPGHTPIRLYGKTFGDTTAEEIYIYPSPAPSSAQ